MILPGSTLGILGGGQLGRMIALAARRFGYRVAVLDPDTRCAAAPVADHVIAGAFDDVEAAVRIAERADVITLEIEKIDPAVLAAVAERATLRPAAGVLEMIRDRAQQRAWLADSGAPLGPWRSARTLDELTDALRELRGPCFVKRCTGGYDGRGQVEVDAPTPEEAERAFEALGRAPVVVEKALTLDYELSVLVVRNPRGDVVSYPPARNHHVDRILAWSAWPGAIESSVAAEAQCVAEGLAQAMKLEGVLVVEMFRTQAGELVVNELAPRVHNSYHASERNADTDQFEQAIRSVCDLPLGSNKARGCAAIVNLLGDLWLTGDPPAWERALAIPTVALHLYGKRGATRGRKMGHLSAVGETLDIAVERAKEALGALEIGKT